MLEALKKEVMEEAAAEGMARGMEEGRTRGMAQGMAQNLISMVDNYLSKNKLSLEQTLDDLSVTMEEYENARNIVGKLG